MEINTEVTVKLTAKEIEQIIVEHLKSKCVDVKSVHFKIVGRDRDGDFWGEFPLDYELEEAICKGVEFSKEPKLPESNESN